MANEKKIKENNHSMPQMKNNFLFALKLSPVSMAKSAVFFLSLSRFAFIFISIAGDAIQKYKCTQIFDAIWRTKFYRKSVESMNCHVPSKMSRTAIQYTYRVYLLEKQICERATIESSQSLNNPMLVRRMVNTVFCQFCHCFHHFFQLIVIDDDVGCKHFHTHWFDCLNRINSTRTISNENTWVNMSW